MKTHCGSEQPDPSDDGLRHLLLTDAHLASIERALGFAALNGAVWSMEDAAALELVREARR